MYCVVWTYKMPPNYSAEQIKEQLIRAVNQHTSEFQDDLSLVVLKVL